MRNGAIVAGALVIGALPFCVGHAADRAEPRAALFQKLIDCRAIHEPTQRLACFDAQVDALDQAEAKRDVVVVDRAQVRAARRSLFGLTLPNLAIFGGGAKDAEEKGEGFTEIETTIARAYRGSDGHWVMILADGAKWLQTDTRELPSDPAAGKKIHIRKAALGSYFANINGAIAVRVQRQN